MAATANPLAGPQEKQSLLKRLLMALPAMAQGGIDAAATPNIANGGVMDLFRAASNSSNLALERALKKSEERRAQQADIWKQADLELRQKDFERLERQGDAAIKYNEARAKQADINEQNNVIETRRTAFTNARNGNPSNTGVAPAAEKARLIASGHTILMEHPDGALLYELTDADKNAEAERKSNVPISQLEFDKLAMQKDVQRRNVNETLTETRGLPGMSTPISLWQGGDKYGPPAQEFGSILDIPLVGNGVTPVRSRTRAVKTSPNEGYEFGIERDGVALDKKIPKEKAPATLQAGLVKAIEEGNDEKATQYQELISGSVSVRTLEAAIVAAYQAGDKAAVDELTKIKKSLQPSGQGQISLTDAGVAYAARALNGGVMLPMGNQSGMRAAVINRAAELDPGGNYVAAKMDSQSLQRSITQNQLTITNLEPFVGLAVSNLDRVKAQVQKISDTGAPILNMPWREAMRYFGSEDQALFDAFLLSANKEVARILQNPTAGGVLSDFASKELASVLSGNFTVGQVLKVTDGFRQEIGSRISELKKKRAELLQDARQLGSGGASTPDAPGTPDQKKLDSIVDRYK